jgi:demethylmenaquinone methyltransferase/2-methoxy-6-polyprenyl-1,4-benzoquinol methylase
MFARIARAYDLNNRLHSLGRDQAWRRRAVAAAGVTGGEAVLDAACGTGDLAGLFARAGAGRVVGLDFCPEMLDVARRKSPSTDIERACGDAMATNFSDFDVARRKSPSTDIERACEDAMATNFSDFDVAHHKSPSTDIEWVCGDAMATNFPDGSFDIVSVGFGLRNVADPHRALAEFHRLLRPGGRLVVLEFHPLGESGSGVAARLLAAPLRLYLRRIMPRTAGAIARDPTGAYDYLVQSTESFLSAGELAEAMAQAGFTGVTTRRLTLGIAALHRGIRI